MHTRRVGLFALTLAGLLLVSCSDAAKDVKADATVTACTPTEGAPPRAEGQIRNSSSETSNFTIRITFYDSSGNKVAEGVDVVTSVEPNQSSPWQSTGSASAKGPIECKVTSARRVVSPVG